jgi:4-amino-4-deoxy-L-arabinose transferase-like glycosyltransferase
MYAAGLPYGLGLLGGALLYHCLRRHGIALSTDSIGYLSVAQNLTAGHGFVNYDGRPFVDQPPLYPLLLAALGLLGIAPAGAACGINVTAFALIVCAAARWLLRHVPSVLMAVIGTAAVLLSAPLLFVSRFAWTETLFILWVLLALSQVERSLREGKRSALLLAAGFSALAVLTRYSGVSVIVAGAVVLLLAIERTPIRRIRDVGFFALASTLPFAAWCIRNYRVSGTLMGERAPSSETLAQCFLDVGQGLARWFLSESATLSDRVLLLGVVAVCAYGVARCLLSWRDPGSRWNPLLPLSIVLPSCFIGVYLAQLILTSSSVAFDPIGDRLLSPVYVPLILVLVAAYHRVCLPALRRYPGVWVPGLLAGMLALALVVPCARGHWQLERTYEDAGNFASTVWRPSPLAAHLMAHPPDGILYSNIPDAVYARTGLRCRWIPAEYHYRSPRRDLASLHRFHREIRSGGARYLIWFHRRQHYHLHGLEALRTVARTEAVERCADGILYRLRPLPAPRRAAPSPAVRP